MRRMLLGLVAVSVLTVGTALAQQGTTEMRGRVLDQQNAVLPGVAVVIRNQETGMFRETVSNADGTYFITSVTPGLYEVTATLEGFKKYSRRDITLTLGKTMTLDLQLEVGALTEVVTVTGEAPIVDVTSK